MRSRKRYFGSESEHSAPKSATVREGKFCTERKKMVTIFVTSISSSLRHRILVTDREKKRADGLGKHDVLADSLGLKNRDYLARASRRTRLADRSSY